VSSGAWRRRLPVLGAGLGMLLLVITGVYFLRSFLATRPQPQKQVVQEIHIIRPPPPPPETTPPPPPPPPPPEEKVDVPEPKPDPVQSDEPPPGEQLGLDATGTGAGDGFGLVGRPNGRDLLATGGSAFAYYAGLLKNKIQELLGDDKRIRSGSYSIVVRVWVRADGIVERTSLQGSTGDKDRDRAIESVLGGMTRLSQPPPADMPQPISLRITSRA